MIDYVCFSGDLEGRVCESTTHLHEFFEDPVAFAPGPDGAVRYVAPKAPGFAKFEAKSAGAWAFPHGDSWRDAAAVGAKLHARARAAARAEGDKAATVSEDTLAEIDPRAVYVLQAKCVSVLSRAAAASKKRKAPP